MFFIHFRAIQVFANQKRLKQMSKTQTSVQVIDFLALVLS